MKTITSSLRPTVAAAMLLLPAAFVATALPASALAQPAAAAEVRSLEVRTDGDLGPGARLGLRVVATPRAQVTVRVPGLNDRLELREERPGVYVGRYVLRRGESIREDRDLRVIVRQGNRSASATYAWSEVVAAPVALRIERFGVAPLERFEPGAELRFVLEGAAGGQATVDLPGVRDDVRMREVRPGRYEGGYTLRRSDNLNPNRPVVATLRVGERAVTAELNGPLVQPRADQRAPQLVNIAPREGDSVPPGPVQISANFEDRGGSGVDPASVRILLSGRNVTPDAQIGPNAFSLRMPLPAGRHTVDVTARDRAGNTVRREWSFEVVGVVHSGFPLQVVNLSDNEGVSGASTVVQGRTVPFATVQARVDASVRVPNGFAVAQQVYGQTLQADANGNFSFSFAPRFVLPGTRYDVTLTASRNGVNQDSRMTLIQR